MSNVPWQWPNSTITRVIDADSITARLTRDLGFHGTATFEQRLRLNRINSPPKNTAAGKIAADYVQSLLMSTPFPVNIATVGAYKFRDEWMAEIVLPSGENLSDLLVKKGYAEFWDGQGPRPGG